MIRGAMLIGLEVAWRSYLMAAALVGVLLYVPFWAVWFLFSPQRAVRDLRRVWGRR